MFKLELGWIIGNASPLARQSIIYTAVLQQLAPSSVNRSCESVHLRCGEFSFPETINARCNREPVLVCFLQLVNIVLLWFTVVLAFLHSSTQLIN